MTTDEPGLSAERWIESQPEVQGLVWTTKAELRQVLRSSTVPAGLDVELLADAFHAVDHPAIPNCELGDGSTDPGVRYCVWKAGKIAAEYSRLSQVTPE